jgi:FKBP-type peptidyl-prolyl cis-trans isomerase 2
MAAAKQGDTVRVHYRGTLEDGSEFDSSQGREPLEFTIGEGMVIAGFESAVVGMNPGEKKQTRIPSADAYGEMQPDLVFVVERSALPPGAGDVHPGDILQISFPDGQTAPVRVSEADDAMLKLDANHPLAGKNLVFDLELVSIN